LLLFGSRLRFLFSLFALLPFFEIYQSLFVCLIRKKPKNHTFPGALDDADPV
jgi:hypothetical protein